MVVYKITNNINGKIYIGQTTRSISERWKTHISKHSGCVALKNAIDKYGVENFSLEIIEKHNDLDSLNKSEAHWIKQYNSISPNGYNLMTGGDNSLFSEESKVRMSKSSKGQKAWNKGLDVTDGRVNQYVRRGEDSYWYGKTGPRKGMKHTEEAKLKISKARKGFKVSEKTRKRMSQSHLNSDHVKKIRKPIMCVENGVTYRSMSEAAKKLNLQVSNICHVLKGKRKNTKGYTFVYVGDK